MGKKKGGSGGSGGEVVPRHHYFVTGGRSANIALTPPVISLPGGWTNATAAKLAPTPGGMLVQDDNSPLGLSSISGGIPDFGHPSGYYADPTYLRRAGPAKTLFAIDILTRPQSYSQAMVREANKLGKEAFDKRLQATRHLMLQARADARPNPKGNEMEREAALAVQYVAGGHGENKLHVGNFIEQAYLNAMFPRRESVIDENFSPRVGLALPFGRVDAFLPYYSLSDRSIKV